jgi:hypothetical protein
MDMTKEKNEIKDGGTKRSLSSPAWLIILLAIVFSSIGGLSGAFWAKSYFLSKTFPSLGNEMSISQDSLRRANLIIENAKKIVVEQDNKVKETTASARNGIVGVFEKKEDAPEASTTKPFAVSEHYRIDEEVAEGLIVTSDGWVIVSGLPKNADSDDIIKNFVVITKSRGIHEIDQVMKTGNDPYLFLHLANAKDLPVKGLATFESLTESQLLVAVNWGGKSYLSSLFEKEREKDAILFSDSPNKKMTLSNSLDGFFDNAFIFSLNGEAAAMFEKGSGIVAIDTFLPVINGLLEKKEVKYSSLGAYYVDLSTLAVKDPRYEKGAMIHFEGKKSAIEAGSAAAEAGLKDGDVILSVNNIKIDADNDLANVIRKYPAGEEVNIIYLRDGQENMVKIKLKELKIAQTKI